MKKISFLFLSTLAMNLAHRQGDATFVGPPSSSAGIVDREIERQYEAKKVEPEKKIPLIEIDIPDHQLNIPDGLAIFIEEIQFKGNTIFSKKQLKKWADSFLNRELSMKEIRKLCIKIQTKYAKYGYFLARAFPPVQRIEDGRLTIEIFEGNLGVVTVKGNKHYKTPFILSYVERFKGKPINYDELLKALLLLNENQDLHVGAIFKKGQALGTADVTLDVIDHSPRHVYIDHNNYGSHLTTIQRTGVRVDFGNAVKNGDMLSLIEVVGSPVKNLKFSDAIYQIPLNSRGTSLELGFLYSNFHVERLRSLHLKGQSLVASGMVSHALLRTRRLNTDVFIAFDYKQIKNISLGKTTSFDKLREIQLGFDFDYVDQFDGRNVGDMSVNVGISDFLGGLKPIDKECSRKGAGGRFAIFYLDAQRLQRFARHSLLVLNFSGQATSYKLPLAEQFYIGGVDTVRGYPLASALGDSGYFANLECRIPPPGLADRLCPFSKRKWKEVLQLLGFVDHGGVFLNGRSNERQSTPIFETSAGFGLRIFGPYRLDFCFDVGFPITAKKSISIPIYYYRINLRAF